MNIFSTKNKDPKPKSTVYIGRLLTLMIINKYVVITGTNLKLV